jgi:hypothetical protein
MGRSARLYYIYSLIVRRRLILSLDETTGRSSEREGFFGNEYTEHENADGAVTGTSTEREGFIGTGIPSMKMLMVKSPGEALSVKVSSVFYPVGGKRFINYL